jgi:prepilin-type N-terminal cleavage/methylation domain-containing protein
MNSDQKGFTVVELIVVVVIVVILASVTVFAFGTWRSRTARTEVQNELLQSAAAIQEHRAFNNNLPATQAAFNVIYTPGSAVTLTYIKRVDNTYCLNGVSTKDSAVMFNIDSRNNTSQVAPNQCS